MGSSVFKSTFFKVFEAELSGEITGISAYSYAGISELNEESQKIFGESICDWGDSYIPEFTQEFDIEYPDPFINSSDPLGPDGEPFTEDDGLRLDPNADWASEVINLPTIDAEYELTDILGNNRIIGDLIDLGAYEYMPLEDADGDGISDSNDAFPNNANETLDTDGDGLGDNEDSDDDGDGVDDSVEIATGTDPKQYNSALHSFVQTLGGGTFDADDIEESRLAGQSDVTSDPNTFNLFTQAELTSATEIGNSQGQNAVTSDPNSFGLFSSDDISSAQSEFRILGQQDVVSDPLSYGLYSPSYTIGLIDASRAAGREDVTSDPSAYGLQSTSGSGPNLNSSNVPTSLAGLIEIYRENPVSDSESAIAGAIYYPSDTELLWYGGDTVNFSETYSWDKDTQTLSAYDAINDINYNIVYEFLETSNTSIYMFNYRWYDASESDDSSNVYEGFGFMYDANGDLNENSVSDKEEFLGLSYIEATNEESYVIGTNTSIADELPDSLPILRSSVSNDSSSASLYSLEEIVDLRPGSTMIEIHNGQATLTIDVEESDDLEVWTNGGAASIEIPIDAEAGKKFFRFKMADLNNDADTNPQFQIIEGNFTWEEARVDAISRNGRLAVLDTEAKQSLIENMIQNDLNQNLTTRLRFAIGLSDHLTEGDWRWIDGSQLSYSNWGPNEPNGTSGYDQDYGVLTTGWWSGTESEFGKWNDDVLIFNYSNVYLNGYILEIPIP